MVNLLCVLLIIVNIWGICEIIRTIKDNKDKEAIKQALKDAGYV